MGKGIWIHWAIMALHVVAILLFTRGFLLTRTELPFYSNCSDASQSPCSYSVPETLNRNDTVEPNQQRCWSKPAVGRLVIIVFDALRFDFVAPSTFFQELKPWMNKLQLVQDLAARNASSARIFKAIADPPTTSLQRLKGLTTGGLPTFIDVGNSFGAPAIVEDNLIHQVALSPSHDFTWHNFLYWIVILFFSNCITSYCCQSETWTYLQLAKNGKRVVMMGDDTWTQLFPHHFEKSFPYPSFNVRDLDTVDSGCIDHLLPFLYQEDWDVLIAHFLGVDHAGHIFGVDSVQMIEKLEQYNNVLLKVVEALERQSAPGGLHENTLLLVMGDHGQTVNGDHGGGSAEEVETSMFAVSFKNPPSPILLEFDTSSCELDLDGRNICASSFQQLDFAVTISALLGIPFPFGSIGQVNPQLYALGAGTWNFEDSVGNSQSHSKLEQWMLNYANILCTNSWQVKRYIDIYSASAVIGFSHEDLLHIAGMYAKAEEKWSHATKKLLSREKEGQNELLPALKRQIDLYSDFLASVAELARSKWTEFNLKMMGAGLGIMLMSLLMHFIAIKKVKEQYGFSFTSSGDSGISFGLVFSCFMVVMRACSFLSNSFILEEGKAACFLLATTGLIKMRYSIMKKKMILEAFVFLLLITICRFTIEVGMSKQAPSSEIINAYPSWMLRITAGFPVWNILAEVLPVVALILLAILLRKAITGSSSEGIWKYIVIGTNISYILIAVHWASESNILNLDEVLKGIGRNNLPRLIYAIGFGQLFLLAFNQFFNKGKSSDCSKVLFIKTVAMFSAWSSTVILLLGKQGPWIALAFLIGGYCIMRLDNIELDAKDGGSWNTSLDPVPVTQWSLFAVCLFFCTGHWCAFDGLRYGAAFIGFDEFVLGPQAILLTMDTFGFSLILPIFGLPFLVARLGQTEKGKKFMLTRLSLVYMIYGVITATSVTATIICVTMHRRHLMVWGLFAPKFVFDVAGLILTDILVCVASHYYFSRVEDDDDALQDPFSEK
nr:GPI ethanolamine phosphate transferase 3 isoform X1 [Malus domestica]